MAAADEALVHPRPVLVRPPDRVRADVGPVDVVGVDRHSLGGVGVGADEVLVHFRAVHVRPPDRVREVVGPVEVTRWGCEPERARGDLAAALVHQLRRDRVLTRLEHRRKIRRPQRRKPCAAAVVFVLERALRPVLVLDREDQHVVHKRACGAPLASGEDHRAALVKDLLDRRLEEALAPLADRARVDAAREAARYERRPARRCRSRVTDRAAARARHADREHRHGGERGEQQRRHVPWSP